MHTVVITHAGRHADIIVCKKWYDDMNNSSGNYNEVRRSTTRACYGLDHSVLAEIFCPYMQLPGPLTLLFYFPASGLLSTFPPRAE